LRLSPSSLTAPRDKPAGASDSEKMAALYNIACCHSQMQDTRSGLVALAGEGLEVLQGGEQGSAVWSVPFRKERVAHKLQLMTVFVRQVAGSCMLRH
jgi:hypothetical protein